MTTIVIRSVAVITVVVNVFIKLTDRDKAVDEGRRRRGVENFCGDEGLVVLDALFDDVEGRKELRDKLVLTLFEVLLDERPDAGLEILKRTEVDVEGRCL